MCKTFLYFLLTSIKTRKYIHNSEICITYYKNTNPLYILTPLEPL